MQGEYVQYGCGMCAPEGWLNFDASPTLRAQRWPVVGFLAKRVRAVFPPLASYGDIRKGLPVPDRSCAAVYCSHILEHLSRGDCTLALANTFRILKPGGRFRLVMPDLRTYAAEYMANTSPDASHQFLRAMIMGQETRTLNPWKILTKQWLGHSEHRWMWDYKSMESELKNAGFERIRPAVFGDSGEERFAAVEEQYRWDRSLGMECFRPGDGRAEHG